MIARLAAVLALSTSMAGAAEEARAFGKPLQGVAPTPLADVLEKPTAGKTVHLEGTIGAVCKNKGCWLTLNEGKQSVHVTFEGYSYFVPKDVVGKKVALEGKVLVKEPKPEDVEHLRKEGATSAAASRVSIEATGVVIR
jgi:hypothetical protein